MFTPIHQLPLLNTADRNRYQDRWRQEGGRELHDRILRMIREGAGEDFLQMDFEAGRLGFLENMWDLKGIDIMNENWRFEAGDTFEAIDFSYSQFFHTKIHNAAFSANFSFARLYNCEFWNCTFVFNGFYGTQFERCRFINCDFVEGNRISNCDFVRSEFSNCFTGESLFFECRFSNDTDISTFRAEPNGNWNSDIGMPRTEKADFLAGIKDAYAAGGVITRMNAYFFQQMQAATRHNLRGKEKVTAYVFEVLTGYGIRPLRVVLAMLVCAFASAVWFTHLVGLRRGVLLAAGALFTFGANTDALERLSFASTLIYIVTSFAGVCLVALFITVLANRWFRER